MPERADLGTLPGRAERVAFVLGDPQVMASCHLEDANDVERVPEDVGGEDLPGPRSDGLLEKLRCQVMSRELHAEEDRHQAVLRDRIEGCRKTGRARDDLVPGLQAPSAEQRRCERRKRQQARRGAGVDVKREKRVREARARGHVRAGTDRWSDRTREMRRPAAGHRRRRGLSHPRVSASLRRRTAGWARSPTDTGDQVEGPRAELVAAEVAPRKARYHGTVFSSPSRRDRLGAQPRRRRALPASRAWSRISARAASRMWG